MNQDTAPNRDFQQGNAVHALSVAPDGTLSEPNAVVTFSASDVPAAARIQGLAIVQGQSGDNDSGQGADETRSRRSGR